MQPTIGIIDIENKEIWKDISGFEGRYQASNLGRIKSLERYYLRNEKTKVKVSEKILKGWDNGEGYLAVDLKKEGKSHKKKIHKIICDTFIGYCSLGQMVNHINGVRNDNRVENIEIVTSRENNCHRVIGKKKYSNFIGVTKASDKTKRRKKWIAQITFNGKPKVLGYFLTEEEAYRCRVRFEKENNISNKYI